MRILASTSVVIHADPMNCDPVRVHDLGWAVFGDGLVQSLDTEVGVHRVAEPLAQHPAAGQVHYCHQI